MKTRTQKMLVALAGALSATALLTSCGEELAQLTNSDLNTVASLKDLGNCNSKNKGRMVYVDSSDAIYFCADSVWKEVNFSEAKGVDGKDGKNGADGKNGTNGKDGTNGTSCIVEALKDGSGYDVLCAGKKVGTITNGKDGAKGADGKNGTNGSNGKSAYEIAKENGFKGTEADWLASLTGAQGSSCSVKANEEKNGFDLVCGDKTVTLTNGKDGKSVTGPAGESCSARSIEGSVVITCGDSEPVVIQNGTNGLDASDDGCKIVSDKGGVVTFECREGEDVRTKKLYKATCNNEPFDPETHFCYFNEEERTFSVVELCGGRTYIPGDDLCEEGKLQKLCHLECNSEGCTYHRYDVDVQFCYGIDLYDLCDGKDYDPTMYRCKNNKLEKIVCGGSKLDLEKQFCATRGGVEERAYNIVKIGEQTWMAENLNYETENSWCGGGSGTTDGDCAKYGRVYTWAAAMGKTEEECGGDESCDLGSGYVQGACPDGWHLPDADEFKTLASSVDPTFTDWREDNEVCKNLKSSEGGVTYLFSALPAGARTDLGRYVNEDDGAYFWSTLESGFGSYVHFFSLFSGSDKGSLDELIKSYAISVRCLKDEP
ncbi:major paralogous domain-containing protein [Fibrobacter sp. UWB16]|uniref:FISUMP domain-containing protein n=1 Tax=unclassified Fibrobacter TaxID=2634177 RepID=UPI000B5256BE|nr:MULTISPECIES: FISUMP domain-containing protein [unclassified Fibrobacter]OWV21433.1 hypothetical protein B7991_05490 [Fibrobacter sp. UWB3]SOD12127.1 major paralogous domain-containing protein [Fibrobacter sp. UWB16]